MPPEEIDWRWPHFSREEMACKCGCGRCEMDPGLMDELEALRGKFGKPMPVTSGYRCPDYNARVSPATGREGPHTTGRAVDIGIAGGPAMCLVSQAFGHHRFTGLGVKQHGPREGRFIHLDTIHEGPRPAIWSYPA